MPEVLTACASCEAVAAELSTLRARLERLEALMKPPARVVPDGSTLVAEFGRATAGYAFSAAELLAHARTDAPLRHALYTARLRTPRDVGQCLRRLAADPPEGALRV